MRTHCRLLSILMLICGGLGNGAGAASLTVLTSFSETPVRAMVAGFTEANPGVRVEVIYRRTLPALRLLTQADGPRWTWCSPHPPPSSTRWTRRAC
ncbi:hypothetical protein ACSZML_17590 [Aeromonas rivipollensis]